MCFANLWLFPKAQSGKSYDFKLMIDNEFLSQNRLSSIEI
jgi:hypothetical protein